MERRIFRFLWNRHGENEEEDNEDSDADNDEADEEETENDDTTAETAVSATYSSPVSEITFDISLPQKHAYLGGDLEDVHGRTIHDDESHVTLPVLSLPGVVLLPGQMLPLFLFQPSMVAMIKQVLDRDRTFAYIAPGNFEHNEVTLASVGTTVEVLAVKEDVDNLTGVAAARIRAIGRQRFKVLSTTRQLGGTLMASVQILPETLMPDPLDGAVPSTHRRFYVADMFEHGGSEDDEASVKTNKLRRLLAANLTHWPSWVYKQYDAEHLMSLVKRELQSWNETFSMESMPHDPIAFSYWVVSSLPLEDSTKLTLLAVNSAIQRLRAELHIMRACTVFCCRRCNCVITQKNDIFSMSVEGPLGAYVNPGGHVHEMLTVAQARGLRLIGRPTVENSWFDGYAWTITQCKQCSSHMGWRFTLAPGQNLKPEKFWGLCRASLKPGLQTENDIDETLVL